MRAETTFDLVGDLIGVDAVVTGPMGSAKMQLILDTAAVMTTMVPSVAEAVGYSAALRVGWSVTRTAAAEERGLHRSGGGFDARLYDAESSRGRADLGYGIDGVLAINFLRHFNIEIRFADRRIFVEQIAL